MTETTQHWGVVLRPMRKRAGLSLRALGSAAGVDFTYLSKIECGKLPPPSTRTIRRIAAALGGDADEMIAQAGKTDAHYSQRLRDRVSYLERLLDDRGHVESCPRAISTASPCRCDLAGLLAGSWEDLREH